MDKVVHSPFKDAVQKGSKTVCSHDGKSTGSDSKKGY